MELARIIAVRNNKTVYRNGDKTLKVFDTFYSKADVLNEALNQAKIEETGLNIPKVLEVTMIDGKWVIVSEHIKGETLSGLMKKNPGKKNEYLGQFLDLQLEVHSKACEGLIRLKDKMKLKISKTDLPATVRYDLLARLEEMPEQGRLCHGDFIPDNVVITDDKKPYIIDWSHASRGDAAADAAHTYLFFRLNGDDETANKYLDLFCEKSNLTKQYVRKWIPIVAASQTVKGNAFEREFLNAWIDAVDYE